MNSEPRPRSIPAGASVEYRGYKVERCDGIQFGHKTDGGGLRSRLGLGTSRKVKGYVSTDADGYERFHDTLGAALDSIDSRS